MMTTDNDREDGPPCLFAPVTKTRAQLAADYLHDMAVLHDSEVGKAIVRADILKKFGLDINELPKEPSGITTMAGDAEEARLHLDFCRSGIRAARDKVRSESFRRELTEMLAVLDSAVARLREGEVS
jgi:hypothetical protein